MKESRLASAMAYLDEDLISQAEEYITPHRKWYQNKWMKWGMMAAGILLFVLASVLLLETQKLSGKPQEILACIPNVEGFEDEGRMELTEESFIIGESEEYVDITMGDSETSKDLLESLLGNSIIVWHGEKETAIKREEFGIENGIAILEPGDYLFTPINGNGEILEVVTSGETSEEDNKEENNETGNEQIESKQIEEKKEEGPMKRKLLLVGILFITVGLCIGGIAIRLDDTSVKESKKDENTLETGQNVSKIEKDMSEDEEDDLQFFAPPENVSNMEPTEPLINEGKLTMVSGTVMEVSDQWILIRYGEENGNLCRLMIDEDVNVQVKWDGSGLMEGAISQVVEGREISVSYSGGIDGSYPARAYGVSRIIVELPRPTGIIEGTIEKIYDEKSILLNGTDDGLHSSKYWVGTSDDVKIFVGGSQADSSQLKVGQRVLMIYTGGILESYPAQIPGVLEIIAE